MELLVSKRLGDGNVVEALGKIRGVHTVDWEIKKRGRVTYYRKKSNELFSDLVVEELDNGDLKIRFVGMTGAIAASRELGLDEIAKIAFLRLSDRMGDASG